MLNKPFSIFSVVGIEIEYMLVDHDTLNVQPKSDVILEILANYKAANEVDLGDISISNELVLHVLELKNTKPQPPTLPLTQYFQNIINKLQPLLADHKLSLLPTGAHPWMNPHHDTQRWPHGNKTIYQQFNTIFNCQGHGWSNLQSMHVNLPFANDIEFNALHNTTRLLLPLLPALAASTPILDSNPTGALDSRLVFYEKNQHIIPSISGDIIPEYVRTQKDYQENVLQPMYKDIAKFDPNHILQYEWLNSRAAIPKFEYGALEIRILDTQECVGADIAIARAIFYLLEDLCINHYYDNPPRIETTRLKYIYDQTIQSGLTTAITDTTVLDIWQLPKRTMTARDVWSNLIERISHKLTQPDQLALEHILYHGNLSERILRACKENYSQATLKSIYLQLITCLSHNTQFIPE